MLDIYTHYRSRPAICAFPWILIVQRTHKSQIGFVAQSKTVPPTIEQCPNVFRSDDWRCCLFDPSIRVSVKLGAIFSREKLAVEVGEGISEGFWAFIGVFRIDLNLWIMGHQLTWRSLRTCRTLFWLSQSSNASIAVPKKSTLLLWHLNLKMASFPSPNLGDGTMAIWWSLLMRSVKRIKSADVIRRESSGLGGTGRSASKGTWS